MNEYMKKIQEIAEGLPEIKIMEVCGGHTHTLMKYGIRNSLPKNIKLVSGPGCPVCVTAKKDIDAMVELALSGVTITTYGDMLKVPGSRMSLADAKSKGADIKTIYSTTEVLKYPGSVFFGIGFETTTPMTAFLLQKGVKVYSTHKVMPPPMKLLSSEDSELNGFILPGHVSAIIGMSLWNSLNMPQVISGFAAEQMVRAIYKLIKLIKEKKNVVINDYPEVVLPEGNLKALNAIEETMKPSDADWRGIGVIPESGLEPRNDELNARIAYEDTLKDVEKYIEPEGDKGCQCGPIIMGKMEPTECPLFRKVCTPDNPQGACMVSDFEGACAIAYRYAK